MATSRAILMTIGQLSFYDQIKQTLISSGVAEDNLQTHFASSISAVSMGKINNFSQCYCPTSVPHTNT